MPESSSSFDDPFADLFDKLPDPRRRETSRGTEGDQVSAPSGASAPTSRRAAREAAARDAAARDAGRMDGPDEASSAVSEIPAAPPASPPSSSPAAQPSSSPAPQPSSSPAAQPSSSPAPQSPNATPQSTRSGRRRPPEDARPAAPAESLDALFTGDGSTDRNGSTPPPRDKRRRRIGGWIALGIVLVLVGGLAGAAYVVWSTYEEQIREVMGWQEPADYEPGMATGEALVTISAGDTGGPISQSLYDAGVTKTPDVFYDMLVDTGQNPTFYPGVYQLQQQMTSEAALDALLDPENKLENSALLPEGLTVDQSLPLLAEGTGIPLEDFEAAVADPARYGVSADSLEGWLFPAMYTFDPETSATEVIQTMVDRAIVSLDDAGVPEADREEILTIASIIQREAREEADFYKVSRVIQNRLAPDNEETFGRLEMDSTAQYGIGEDDGTVSSSEEALTDDNPWNTYVHPGLPIGPIANPGDVAIDAAMNPADGPWMYFVTVNLDTGETIFTNTYSEHLVAVEQWRDWCSENPDSGC
ncbi:MAG: ABC transporter substrate-binding protein [Zunongwangia sp.]|nr:ABC transporter substrate-binding protein [Zunongwangia sp.]